MAVYFEPQRRDPNAELKHYMLQMAQMLGAKGAEKRERQRGIDFAKSLSPTTIPAIDGQRLFSPGGRTALGDAWLGGQPGRLGMIQGPQLTQMQILQKALQAGFDPQASVGFARMAPKALQPKVTKIQELVSEGYSLSEARMIRDISHGLKPRASARKRYDNMGDVEKLNFLSTLKQRAEGQYFGIDPKLGGIAEPRQPKLLKWINKEIEKLPMLSEAQPVTTEAPTDVWKKGQIPSQSPIGLEPIWEELTDQEKLTAIEVLASGKPAETIIEWFKRDAK